MNVFHRAFATGVACQQGTLTLPDTWFRPPFWDLLVLQLLRPDSSNLPCLDPTFHIEYPLVLSRFCSQMSLSRSRTTVYAHESHRGTEPHHKFANLLPNWTLLPILTLLPNFGGFHRTLQRVRLANRGRLLLRTPVPVQFGTCVCSNV